MIVLLIPLNASALTEETSQPWLFLTFITELVNIADENQPHASAYVTLRNSNDELVGVTHVTATRFLADPLFYELFNIHPEIENVTIEGKQYQTVSSIPIEQLIDADCNNAAQKKSGYGNIHDICFFYSFESGLAIPFESKLVTLFEGQHHGYVVEEGDRINTIWTTLIPIN